MSERQHHANPAAVAPAPQPVRPRYFVEPAGVITFDGRRADRLPAPRPVLSEPDHDLVHPARFVQGEPGRGRRSVC